MLASAARLARAHRSLARLVLVTSVLVVGVAACAADAPSRDQLVDALVTSGLPKAESRCAADAIVDNLTDEQVAQIAERGGGGAPRDDPKDADDTMDKLRSALAACREQAATTSTTSTTSTTGSSSTAPGSSSTAAP